MTYINMISHKAGDLAIIEAMNRLSGAAGEEDVVFRIGGDEFCILTGSDNREYAEGIAERILQKNEETFLWEGNNVGLHLYATVVQLNRERIKYDELFTGLHEAIETSKK